MANIKSAQKRISTIERRTAENKYVKAKLSTLVKKFRKLIEEGNVAEAKKFSKEVYAYIDSACSKGIIHKNTASRKVGRLASALYKAKASAPVAEKKETKKVEKVETTTEPATEKKAPAKRTTKKAETTTEEKPAKKTTKKAETTEEKPAKKTTTRKTTKKAE
ncbi:MAG: 30S ribosomal protein S20 [Clostridia bacterium]|nr:30S ribosomal protein S20 [Clostridia bacterium]